MGREKSSVSPLRERRWGRKRGCGLRRAMQSERYVPKKAMDDECVDGMPYVVLCESEGRGWRMHRLSTLAVWCDPAAAGQSQARLSVCI